jgi:hypothetical protein
MLSHRRVVEALLAVKVTPPTLCWGVPVKRSPNSRRWMVGPGQEELLLLRAADRLMELAHYRPVPGHPDEDAPAAGTFGTWKRDIPGDTEDEEDT